MGSIRALSGRGTLFMDFRYRGKRCREYTALEDTPANRKNLQKVLTRVESQIDAGTFDYAATFPASRAAAAFGRQSSQGAVTHAPIAAMAATPTLRDFTAQWLAEHQVEWRRSHSKVLKSTIEGHLIPVFGDRPVSSITKSEILAFRARLAELPGRTDDRLSNRRINGVLAPLGQILADAAERHGFASPMTHLKRLKVRKSDVDPFTLDQVQTILQTVRPDYRDYFAVRFFTGMRTGECHGLKWKYVDFANRLILVRETVVLGEDEYTKTDSSQRDIQMTQVVFDALRRQHAATSKLSDYVFCNREGQTLDNKNFSDRVWYPLLRHLELSPRRPYQMRHTAATLWLASGEAPEWIARQLGHSNTQMLFQVYSRYVPNLTRRDGSAIDRLLASRFATGQGNGEGSASMPPPEERPPPASQASPMRLAA
jgi:integrase